MQVISALRTHTSRIDHCIDVVRRQGTVVQELGNCIIAEAITGKIDVREAAEALPEGDDLDEDADDGPQGTIARSFEEPVSGLVQSEA